MSDKHLELTDPRERGRGLVRMAVPFYAVMGALAWAWRGGVRGEPIFTAPGATEPWPLAESVALGVALGALVIAMSAVWTTWLPTGRALARFLGETIGHIGPGQGLALAIASGLGEELLFRGALQPEVGLVIASVVFGAMHVVPRWPLLLWGLYAVAVGLAFGLAFEWTGSLWAPVIAHGVVNGVNLPLLSRQYGRGASAHGRGPSAIDASAPGGEARDRVHLDEGTEG